MEAMGRLVSGISHDFNNIITAVRGYAEMLIEFSGLTDKNLEYATEIERAALRASDLISQLMMFARKEVEAASIVDAVTVVSEIQGILETALESNVHLHYVLPMTAMPVRIGRSGLEQVVLNLVINAGDAIEQSGEVTIEVDSFDNDTQVRLRVRDNGVGISATDRDKIFEPFFTTKPIGQGTGLGLPIVYGVVERAGGHITLDSEVGKGTCFTVYFPRAIEAPMSIPAAIRRAQPVTASSLRIIVAEDDESVRQFTVNTLERAGHHVSPARNGADALAILERTSDFDLVLSDIDMPSIGGLQLKAVMRVRFPHIPILLMTGKLDGLGSEGRKILQKPFSGAALCEFVEQAQSSNDDSDVGAGVPSN
jgi:CheY-like chemotaxis protein